MAETGPTCPPRHCLESPLVQADWYDPANDSYNRRLHQKFQARGSRVLAWDLDFDRNMERMAAARLDAVVTDSLQEMLQQKRRLAQRNL